MRSFKNSFSCNEINISSPKLPIYLELRFNNFKEIISSFIGDELSMRNNDKIRKLFAELISILCFSRKKHAFESLIIKDRNDFEITNLTKRLKAPNITFASDLFIPLHIILVSISPDAPTSAPAIINPLFIKTNPVAEAAIPEYEFNREITTGMSAPPIGIVRVMPMTADIATSR